MIEPRRLLQRLRRSSNPTPQMQQTGDAGDELPRLDRLGRVHLVGGEE